MWPEHPATAPITGYGWGWDAAPEDDRASAYEAPPVLHARSAQPAATNVVDDPLRSPPPVSADLGGAGDASATRRRQRTPLVSAALAFGAFALTAVLLVGGSRLLGRTQGAPSLVPPQSAPASEATVPTSLPVSRDPSTAACNLLRRDEAAAALGVAIATVVPIPIVAAGDAPACGFYATGRPSPNIPRVVVAVVDGPQFAAQRVPALVGVPTGPTSFETFIAGRPLGQARAGIFDGSRGAVVAVIGATTPDSGQAASHHLAVLATNRR